MPTRAPIVPSITVTGVEKAQLSIEVLGTRAIDPRPAWPALLRVFATATKERFASSGAGTWAPLSQATIDSKRSKGQDPRVLRATGALYRSVTAMMGTGAIRDKKSATELQFGTEVPYAVFHQEGRGTPKRTLFDINEKTLRRVHDELTRYLMGEASRAR